MRASRVCHIVLFIGVMLLAACVHDPYSVDVIDATDSRYGKVRQKYVVQKGDTLYGIAFKFGITVKEVSRLNGIKPPYIIYPSQTLWVYADAPKRVVKTKVQPKKTVTSSVKKPVVKPVPKKPKAAPVKPKKDDKKPVVTKPKPAPVVSVKPSPKPRSNVVKAPKNHAAKPWIVPTTAKRGKTFTLGKSAHKGVDYHGQYGSPIVASRSGVVVYAGNGLQAYGLLVIIKHDNNYLSAYAYNKRILVKEGERVEQGQTIAEMGKKADTVTLHFEIRRDGKPVNPLVLLSK